MTSPESPHLKSNAATPHRPDVAEQPRERKTVGASKVVAEGVLSGSDPHPAHDVHPLLTKGEAA
ncbi:hypothetical protein SNARM312S_00580 [Streptomyces narbonensis]